jgi:DNA-binding MarR family transcriptional regulator
MGRRVALRVAFARKVETYGVTVAEWVLMRQLLGVEALAPSRLAECMGMTRGAVSKLADRLIAKSLLVRTADPQDGRAQTLSLTRAGRSVRSSRSAASNPCPLTDDGHFSTQHEKRLT